MLVPEAGDTVQTMKAGLLEIADIFVVNKADREGAARIKAELEMMLQLRPAADWTVPVLLTEGTTGKGVDELLAAVLRHRDFLARSGAAPRRTRPRHATRSSSRRCATSSAGASKPALEQRALRAPCSNASSAARSIRTAPRST